MTDWSAVTIAAMEAQAPGATWDVLPGRDAPEGMPVCCSYPSVSIAADVLAVAGFKPARHAIPAPGLNGPYDLSTVMQYTAGGGQDVVLVRRS